ncbi:amidase family protein [Altererythrobacter lutimaris]|uniref:Amidase n=1 Tax=Altererythrobacter lutimaris TaxID=2743979 RepID=A0A850HDD9_9SPHN|nr:amidase [Altererythrobacter lutimaris]NVE95630.1 amidase [Altererythrobacter lutimaris]
MTLDRYNAFAYRDDAATGSEDGTLAGLSVGVKANIMVEGMPFHAGIGAWEYRKADRDAEVVAKLRAAGAAITGVLHMEEAALGSKTDNPHFGPVQNPHGEGFSPGGSSGGSGAAVSAGLVDIAFGTDTMGSVRIPASHCGVYGFKPATSRVSQDGLEPADLSLDAIGPLARDLDTLEKAARVISDFGENQEAFSGAVLVDHGVEIDSEVARAFRRTVAGLKAPPAEVSLEHPCSRIRYAGFIQVSKVMAKHLQGVPVSDHLAKLLTYGPARASEKWGEDRHILERTSETVRTIIAEHGFLIMPTVPNPPFKHTEPEPPAQADFTCLANIAGVPALSMPMGCTEWGLPLGVQMLCAPGFEKGLFALARFLDNNLRAYRAPAC